MFDPFCLSLKSILWNFYGRHHGITVWYDAVWGFFKPSYAWHLKQDSISAGRSYLMSSNMNTFLYRCTLRYPDSREAKDTILGSESWRAWTTLPTGVLWSRAEVGWPQWPKKEKKRKADRERQEGQLLPVEGLEGNPPLSLQQSEELSHLFKRRIFIFFKTWFIQW